MLLESFLFSLVNDTDKMAPSCSRTLLTKASLILKKTPHEKPTNCPINQRTIRRLANKRRYLPNVFTDVLPLVNTLGL